MVFYCYYCGQEGHYKNRCYSNPDHDKEGCKCKDCRKEREEEEEEIMEQQREEFTLDYESHFEHSYETNCDKCQKEKQEYLDEQEDHINNCNDVNCSCQQDQDEENREEEQYDGAEWQEGEEQQDDSSQDEQQEYSNQDEQQEYSNQDEQQEYSNQDEQQEYSSQDEEQMVEHQDALDDLNDFEDDKHLSNNESCSLISQIQKHNEEKDNIMKENHLSNKCQKECKFIKEESNDHLENHNQIDEKCKYCKIKIQEEKKQNHNSGKCLKTCEICLYEKLLHESEYLTKDNYQSNCNLCQKERFNQWIEAKYSIHVKGECEKHCIICGQNDQILKNHENGSCEQCWICDNSSK